MLRPHLQGGKGLVNLGSHTDQSDPSFAWPSQRAP